MQGKLSTMRFTRAAADPWDCSMHAVNVPSNRSCSTYPASRKQYILSPRSGIGGELAVALNTCLSKSSVHSPSFTQNDGLVIGVPEGRLR